MAARLPRLSALFNRNRDMVRPTVFLFAVDTLANAIDYAFHIYLGRALPPPDFAVLQTVNSALLIAVTAFGVMQPVIARQVAEAEAGRTAPGPLSEESVALFRAYFLWSGAAGLALGGLVLAAEGFLGGWLNLPDYAVRWGALVVFLILLRPVVAGALQGAQRFVPFGATRLAYAAGRFLFAGLVLALGAGLPFVIAALPVGQFLAVGSGLAFLGAVVWQRQVRRLRARRVADGLRLAGWAFLAYAAFTALQNIDLLVVNRLFPAGEAGAYAAAVLLRRVLILFPGAAAVVMYPRIVARVAQGRLPDRLIGWTILFVTGSVVLLAGLYAFAGPAIVQLAFGEGYGAAGPLLGVLGAAMLGYAIGAIWMNLFLATRPALFVSFLAAAVPVQVSLLSIWHADLAQVALVFAATGWAVALAGGLLYLFWLRPALRGVSSGP